MSICALEMNVSFNLEMLEACNLVQSTAADEKCLYFWEIPLLTVCFPVGPTSEESGEQVCLAAENRGGSHQVVQRGRPLQDGEEKEEKQLSGCNEEAGGHREGDQRLQDQERKDTHPKSLTDLSR